MEQKPSFIVPATIPSIVVGLVLSIVSTIILYMTISGEPSGSFFQPISFMQIGICLLGAVSGVLAVKAYQKLGVDEIPLGQGAVIGVYAAFVTALTMTVVGAIWNFVIDPALMDNFSDYMIRNMEMAFENAGLSGDQMDQALGEMEKGFQEQKTLVGMLKGFGFTLIGVGIVNVISGIITAKVVSKED